MSAPPAGDAVMVAALPGGMLFAHGLSCPECQFRYCALWGFAPLGQLPPNGICPECTHRWALPSAMRDALAVAASINRVAVLLDADNFEGVQLPELKAWFEQRGQLLIFRAYGNQKTFAGSVWQHALEVGLDLVTCDVRPQAADMAIAVDLGVLASARQYHELYVVSGDRALLIAAEHVASRFGERQHVYWGLPHPLMHHTVQCQIGTKHARKEELVGLLELLIFQGGGRVKSDALHRTLLDTVPWFHARIYGAETFIFFLSEHFVIERAGEGCYVSLPDGGRSVGVTAPLPPVAPGRVGNDRRRRRDHDRRE